MDKRFCTTVVAHLALLTASAIPLAGAARAEPAAAVNTEGLPAHVRARIEEKAAQGQAALIQYLHRTQTVHQLRPEMVIVGERSALAAQRGQPARLARIVRPRV